MNEVFNSEYKPEIEDENDLIYQHQQRIKKYSSKAMEGDYSIDGNECFKNFIKRNKKWS